MTHPGSLGGLVITGMGVITAAGGTPEALWSRAVQGASPAVWWHPPGPIMADPIPACVVTSLHLPTDFQRYAVKSDRCAQLALAAAIPCWQQARLDRLDPQRIGILVGSARGPVGKVLEADRQAREGKVRPTLAASGTGASVSGLLSSAFQVTGPCFMVSASCASAANAMALGAHMILTSEVDAVLVGGTEAPLVAAVTAAFQSAGILGWHDDPRRACRPFDVSRNGLLLGEGAGFVVIESEASARRRGVESLARLLGWAIGAEGRGRTTPEPHGAGLVRVIGQALNRAGIDLQQVDYVNAHGTGTSLNDQVEARTLQKILGERAAGLPCSSTKPITGHCLGATPALEAILAIQALQHQMIPPTVNFEQADPQCRLDLVPNRPRPAHLEVVLSNSLGFWGNNAALILSRSKD